MEQKPGQKDSLYNKLSIFSIMAGVLALTSCCYPPVQLVLGAAAVMMAYLSKNSKPFTIPAIIGMIMGVLSIIISVLIFVQFVWAMDMMSDPSNAAMVKEIYRQYQDVFNNLLQTQPAN